LEIFCQYTIGLLSRSEIAGLQVLAELVEQLIDRRARTFTASVVVMRLGSLTLKVLLDSRKILLGTGNVAKLEIFRQLAERLNDRTAILRRSTGRC
jgi:hypothetical protein